MKFQIFALLLLSVSIVSATDCWQLTSENGEPECFYISFDNCEDIYYDEFFNCERERLTIEYYKPNIVQQIVEDINPDYDPNKLSKIYDMSNIQLFLIGLFFYLLYMILNQ